MAYPGSHQKSSRIRCTVQVTLGIVEGRGYFYHSCIKNDLMGVSFARVIQCRDRSRLCDSLEDILCIPDDDLSHVRESVV